MTRRRDLRGVCLVGGNHRDITRGLEPGWHLAQDRTKSAVGLPPRCEVVFVLTRFVSHAVTESLIHTARHRRIPVVLVTGGKSTLKREILAWLAGKTSVGYRLAREDMAGDAC